MKSKLKHSFSAAVILLACAVGSVSVTAATTPRASAPLSSADVESRAAATYRNLQLRVELNETSAGAMLWKYGETSEIWGIIEEYGYGLLEESMNSPSYAPTDKRRAEDIADLAMLKAKHKTAKDWITAYEGGFLGKDDDWGCKAALCWVGGTGVSECSDVIAKVTKQLAKGKPWPTCNGISIPSLFGSK